jgi:dihydroorotate dehydrogenase (NAD+) catalytic subunit
LLANRYGGLSGRAVKPIGLRVVAELRDAGITLPVIATGGIRTFDDCREYFWAGADAVSLGSASWLASYPGYVLAPLWGWRIRSILKRIELVSDKQGYSAVCHSPAAQQHGLPNG